MSRGKVHADSMGRAYCRRRTDLPKSTDVSEITCNKCRGILGLPRYEEDADPKVMKSDTGAWVFYDE